MDSEINDVIKPVSTYCGNGAFTTTFPMLFLLYEKFSKQNSWIFTTIDKISLSSVKHQYNAVTV